MKTLLAAGLVAAALGMMSIPTCAAPVGIMIDVAPPPPRVEVLPAPRRGYAWVPGYWNWVGHRHVWVRGTWVRERRGYVYAEPRWMERDGHWEFRRGEWARGDRDHDGVPNGVDRHPNDPRRP
jgi:hypothetical protein